MPNSNFLSNRHFFTRFYCNIVLTFINEITPFSGWFKLNILIMYSVDHEFSISLKKTKNWFCEEWVIYGKKSQILAILKFLQNSRFHIYLKQKITEDPKGTWATYT